MTSRIAPRRAGIVEHPRPSDLADLLDRVLDKGVVIAGDIRVDLLDIELLTIKVRLLVAGADKAREMGICWWEDDPFLTTNGRALARENELLRARIEMLEARLEAGPVRARRPEIDRDEG